MHYHIWHLTSSIFQEYFSNYETKLTKKLEKIESRHEKSMGFTASVSVHTEKSY